MAIFQLRVCGFCCHLFLLGLNRGSHVSVHLFDVGVFLAVSCFYSFLTKKTAKSETVSHVITTALFRVRPHLYSEFNSMCRRSWGWSDKLSIRLPGNFLTCHSKEKTSPRISVISAFTEKGEIGWLEGLQRVLGMEIWRPGLGKKENWNLNWKKKSDVLD